MEKFGALLLLLATSVYLLWTLSYVCVITSFCRGLAPDSQTVIFPERTAQNDTQRKTGLANMSARLIETAEKINNEMGKPPEIVRNNMETTQIINDNGSGQVEKHQKCDVINAGGTVRNASRLNYTETEPNPGDKHIIFIETGCVLDKSQDSKYKGLVLHKWQVCAIESAAKMNPDYKVYLLYSCPIHGTLEDSSEYVQTLFTYPNVHLWKLGTRRHFLNTPLENWNFQAAIMTSSWPTEHSSDVLRFLTLWKYGGTYLDMDFVILKSLDALGTNYVSLESPDTVGSSVLSFAWDGVGHTVAGRCLEELRTNFRGEIRIHNGPGLITRVLLKMCNCSKVAQLSTERCGGFRILSHRQFFPIPFYSWRLFVSELESQHVMDEINDSFGVYLWNKLSKNTAVNAGSQQPYSLIAARACPRMYGASGGYF